MSDSERSSVLARAFSVYSWASKIFRIAFHWGIIPFIIVVGVTTKRELTTTRGNIKTTPSLFEIVLPVALNPDTGRPTPIIPF